MVDSMRKLGRFDGDIIIYTDQLSQMNGAECIYRPALAESFAIMGSRWAAGCDMDVLKYDKVAMIDADVVAINPVSDIFALDCSSYNVWAAEEFPDGRAFHGNSPWSFHGIEFDGSTPVHNAGVVMASSKYWNKFCELMWSSILIHRKASIWPYQWIDQQVLNHLERWGLISLKQFPDDWVCMFRAGREICQHTRLIHALPNGKERIMRVLYGMALGLHRQEDNGQYEI
jgi:hypothetical protein